MFEYFGHRVENLAEGEEVGNIILYLPHGLPQYSPIEVTFALQRDGRLQFASFAFMRTGLHSPVRMKGEPPKVVGSQCVGDYCARNAACAIGLAGLYTWT